MGGRGHGGTGANGLGGARENGGSMGEADPGLLYGGQPSHRGRAVFRGEPRGFVHPVQQSVKPGSSDVGLEVARGRLTDS